MQIFLYFLEQQYNMTGSSEYAELGKTFMWTCEMFVPSGMTVNAVFFQRNGKDCGLLVHNEDGCLKVDLNPRYTFACVSAYSYALTIPAENMTEYENGSVWGCFYPGDGSYKSPDVVLNIASKMIHVHIHHNQKQINHKCSRFSIAESLLCATFKDMFCSYFVLSYTNTEL